MVVMADGAARNGQAVSRDLKVSSGMVRHQPRFKRHSIEMYIFLSLDFTEKSQLRKNTFIFHNKNNRLFEQLVPLGPSI